MTRDHPPEELLEVLVLASDEMDPELQDALTSHARHCALCRSVMGLLLQFHRSVAGEDGEPGPAHALVTALFADDEEGATSALRCIGQVARS